MASLLRRRAFMLLLAFGVGLVVQIGVATAMPMAHGAGMPASPASDHCPACGDHGSPKATAPCMSGLQCSLPPAILGTTDTAMPVRHATFSPVASADAAGITLAPDLGPPRLPRTI